MDQVTANQNQLAKLRDTEIDLSEFGQEPLLLARISDDPMHMGVVGIVASILMLASPGFNWLLLAAFWLFNANDIVWSLGEDAEEDDEGGPIVDTSAQEVIDEAEATPEQQPQQSDNWVDEAVDDGAYSLPEAQAQPWPPVVETVPVTTGFQRAKDVIADTTPADLLNLMGESAPDWLKRAAVSEGVFVSPGPLECERLDAPEAFEKPVVQVVSGTGLQPVSASEPVRNQFQSEPVAKPVLDYSAALAKIAEKAPYTVPVQGPKGQVYHIVKTAVAAGKSQNWMVENLFQLSKGKNQPYQDAVRYIKWVKDQ